MKRIQLALIRQRYSAFGGAERFVSNAMQALQHHAVDVTLITRDWQTNDDFTPLIRNPFYVGRLWRDWSFAHAVRRSLAQHPFDLVQSHERISGCDVYRAGDGVHREWLAQNARTLGPCRKLLQRFNPYHLYTLAAEKTLFNHPKLKAIICNSLMVKNELHKYFAVQADKLHVIYSGVDLNRYHPSLQVHKQNIRHQHAVPGDATLFLFVGSGFHRKGLRAAILALQALPDDVHLLVVGKDKALKRFQQLSLTLGLGGRVHFAGPQADVAPYYGAADALVLPTLYDPFPNVALEALASGLPVVTSFKSGAAEIIQTGVNGYVCDALDITSLSAHMLHCANQGQTMKIAARASVNDFSQETMSRRLVNLYNELLAR